MRGWRMGGDGGCVLTVGVEAVVGAGGVQQQPLEAGQVLRNIPWKLSHLSQALNILSTVGGLLGVRVGGEGGIDPLLDSLQHPEGQLVLEGLGIQGSVMD